MIRPVLSLLFVCLIQMSRAATYNAASGASADVSAAVALTSPAGGDTVQVPSGSFNITSQILITNPLSLIFSGTVWSNSMPANGSPSLEAMIHVSCQNVTNQLFRVSGFTMEDGTASPANADAGAIRLTGWGTMVRIDHVTSHLKNQLPLAPMGPIGVSDHCVFAPNNSLNQPMKIAHDGFMNQGSFGDYSWAVGPLYGTSNAWYIEDCFITNNTAPFEEGMSLDCQGGGRYVLRHCTVVGCYIGGHGTETTQRERGSRTKEVYNNLLIGRMSGGQISELGHFRSGSGIICSNTFINAQSAFVIRAYRLTSNVTPWGPADGTDPWDVNDATIYGSGLVTSGGGGTMFDALANWTPPNQWNGFSIRNATTSRASLVANGSTLSTSIQYVQDTFGAYMTFAAGNTYQYRKVIHILDSPGRGMGALMSNNTPVINGVSQWPNEALEPIYCWSNTYVNVNSSLMGNGGFYTILVDVPGAEVQNTNPPAGVWSPFVYPHPLVQQPDPSIDVQPQDQSVTVGSTATFSVTASTSHAPLTYQWSKNGSSISGATQSAYTTPGTVCTDNNSTFTVSVANSIAGTALSRTAVLTVTGCTGTNVWYAAANGTSSGAGTIGSPWDLATALKDNSIAANSNHVMHAGDTLYMRAGTYKGSGTSFWSGLIGANRNPITVLPYPGERATIDGNYDGNGGSDNTLVITNSDVDFKLLEVFNSFTNRGSVSGRPSGIVIGDNAGPATRIRIINCIIHDTGVGIFIGNQNTNCQTYGNVIYNCGYQNVPPDRGHGHALYVQQPFQNGVQTNRDNIALNTFDVGIQAYEEGGSKVENILLEGNISANSGAPNDTTLRTVDYVVYSTTKSVRAVTANSNFAYNYPGADTNGSIPDTFQIGNFGGAENSDCILSNNYFANGLLSVQLFTNVVVTNNTILTSDASTKLGFTHPGVGTNIWIWGGNMYASALASPFDFNGFPQTFASWKSVSGFDATSTFSSSAPNASVAFARANAYQPNRANIAVFNWASNDNVSVDLTGIVAPGQGYTVANAFDFYGAPVKIGTYAGGTISLPMTNLNVVAPLGVPAAPKTSPGFGAFVLLPTAIPVPPNTNQNLTIRGRLIVTGPQTIQ